MTATKPIMDRYHLFIIIFSSIVVISLFFSSARADMYPLPPPGNDIVGENFTVIVRPGDNLDKIATRYRVALHEMIEANPRVNPYRLRVGQQVIVPKQYILPPFRKGLVINVPELRLYYFTKDGYVITHPVGLGRTEWRTPLTSTTIVRKQAKPTWHVPKSIKEFVYEKTGRVLPDSIRYGEPLHPLGEYALYLGKRGYLIHGTNQPYSVGKFVSSGCIRLYDDGIDELFHAVTVGTPVRIIHHSVKAGWSRGQLYLEAHGPVDMDEPLGPLNIRSGEFAVENAINHKPAYVDWYKIQRVQNQHTGLPTPVGERRQAAYATNNSHNPSDPIRY